MDESFSYLPILLIHQASKLNGIWNYFPFFLLILNGEAPVIGWCWKGKKKDERKREKER